MKAISLYLLISVIFLQSCSDQKKHYQGYISGTNTYISSEFSGKLKKILVKKGDKVKKGELLYVLDNKPEIFNLHENNASIDENVAQLNNLKKPKRIQNIEIVKAKITEVQAQINLAQLREVRNQTLFDRKVLAKDSLDFSHEHLNELLAKKKQLESQLELYLLGARPDIILAKQFSIKSLKYKLEKSAWSLSTKVAYSPGDGVVYDTYFNEDEIVLKAKPVLAVLLPENIYLEFFVPYKDIKNLFVGAEIQYSLMGDEENLKVAKISYISPEAEYIPPLVYSRDNSDKIVFKIRAIPVLKQNLTLGIPITIIIDSKHA